MNKQRNIRPLKHINRRAVRRPVLTVASNLNRMVLTAALGISPLPTSPAANLSFRLGRDEGALALPQQDERALHATWQTNGACRWQIGGK